MTKKNNNIFRKMGNLGICPFTIDKYYDFVESVMNSYPGKEPLAFNKNELGLVLMTASLEYIMKEIAPNDIADSLQNSYYLYPDGVHCPSIFDLLSMFPAVLQRREKIMISMAGAIQSSEDLWEEFHEIKLRLNRLISSQHQVIENNFQWTDPYTEVVAPMLKLPILQEEIIQPFLDSCYVLLNDFLELAIKKNWITELSREFLEEEKDYLNTCEFLSKLKGELKNSSHDNNQMHQIFERIESILERKKMGMFINHFSWKPNP